MGSCKHLASAIPLGKEFHRFLPIICTSYGYKAQSEQTPKCFLKTVPVGVFVEVCLGGRQLPNIKGQRDARSADRAQSTLAVM